MNTSVDLIEREQLSALLYNIIAEGGEESHKLLALFGSQCDCSIAEELRKRINEGDFTVINILKERIKAPVYPTPPELITS